MGPDAGQNRVGRPLRDRHAGRDGDGDLVRSHRKLGAVDLLAGVDLDALSPENRKEMLKKQAVCQKRMNDVEGAHNTYLRLLKEDPSPEVERIARQNYEQYLRDQCERKPVLEKITTLDGY